MDRLHSVLAFACFALLGVSGMACSRVKVDDVRGPDGGDWKKLSCSHMDKRCYQRAAALCPNGYYFAHAAGPAPAVAASAGVSDDDDSDASGSVRATAPHPQAGANTKTLPPQERWSSGMYSKKSGAILVQCADAVATR